ncbi:unnamed protein product [Rotaria sordida]|uniref:HTH psq-type domain-containing protein n=1 Tax=Rotaria sordida TaxID=392033 RepID=A0A819NUC2_9BILA|nr:unnamed protein product [Rotaria sordida]
MTRKYIEKTIKKYSDHDFQLANESVCNDCSIREAVNTFHVPYTTLNSHVNNEVLYDQVSRPTKFTKEEESYLKQAALVLQEKQLLLISFLIFL